MIPYMVGKLAPNSSHLTRGLVKYVPGRDYFRAVSSQNGDTYVTSPPLPIVELVGSRLSDVGGSCRTSRMRRGRCDGALAGFSSCRAPVSAEVYVIPEGVLARAPTGVPGRVLRRWVSFPAEELQQVGCWLGLTNSGVVETTYELVSVLQPP